jgi:hypothetical protein
MAQRKPAPSMPKKSASAAKAAAGKTPAGKTLATTSPVGRPPVKRTGKSIVNQKQTPWGLIWTTVAVVVFAAAIVVAVVVTRPAGAKPAAGGNVGNCKTMDGLNKTDTYLNELVCAKNIKGVTFKQEPNRNHVDGVITYDSSPPVGGNHAPVWGDCTGTVYPVQIANENAVHMLEHGAVWITYKPGLASSQLTTLKGLVTGQERMAMSPFAGLKTPISLQAWGYQLFVNSATDPRIKQFISDLRYNPLTTPEYGATCSNPSFKLNPSTLGHPVDS